MYNEKIEALIKAALADGVLTEKEKQILFKKAQAEGIDLDEFEMVLDARLVELQKEEKEKSAKSAPKSDKYGDVRKCPVCGALVPALGVTCAECGYEFTGIASSSSSQLLSKKIEEVMNNATEKKNKILTDCRISDKKEKDEFYSPRQLAIRAIEKDAKSQIESILQNFPVPNAKNDLFDLLLYLKNNIKEEAYEKKYKECLDRANLLYPSDPIFAQMKEDGKKAISDKKAEESGNIYMFATLGIATFSSLALCIIWGLNNDWGFWMWTGYIILAFVIGELGGLAIGAILKKLYLKTNKALATAIITTVYIVLCAIPVVWPITIKIVNNKKIDNLETLIVQEKADEAKALHSRIKYTKKNAYKFYDSAEAIAKLYISQGKVEQAINVLRTEPRSPQNRDSFAGERNSTYRKMIKEAYIKEGEYNKAWEYVGDKYTSDGLNAKYYYTFMTEVVLYLCGNNRKQDAKQFVKDYSTWFVTHIDSDSYYSKEYPEYKSSIVRKKLLQLIANS